MTVEPEVTVVVVTFRAASFLGETLAGLAAQTAAHRLLIIDNASTDGTADVIAAAAPGATVHRLAENAGFAGGVAAALPLVQTRYVALLNDDAVPRPDWLAQLLGAADGSPGVAAWTSLMVLRDLPEIVNNLGAALNTHWYGIDVAAGASVATVPSRELQVFGFCGGAALLRTAAVRAVGGFPAEFFLYYEDLDTSWRLRRAGWTIAIVPRGGGAPARRDLGQALGVVPLPQRAQPAADADPVRSAGRGAAPARPIHADHRVADGQTVAAADDPR